MRAKNIVKNVIIVMVLMSVMFMLPMFKTEANAAGLSTGIIILKADGNTPAIENVDYEIDGHDVKLIADNLVIKTDGSVAWDYVSGEYYTFKNSDATGAANPLHVTLENFDLQQWSNRFFYFTCPTTMTIKGDCKLNLGGDNIAAIATADSLYIKAASGEDTLRISTGHQGMGIDANGSASDKEVVIGDGTNHLTLKIDAGRSALAGHNDVYTLDCKANTDVSLKSVYTGNCTIDGFETVQFAGNLKSIHTGSSSALYVKNYFYVLPGANLWFTTQNGSGAIYNAGSQYYNNTYFENAFDLCGKEAYDESYNFDAITEEVKIDSSEVSTIVSNGNPAKTVVFKNTGSPAPGPAPDPTPGSGSHTHNFEYQVIKAPSIDCDGEEAEVCTICGAVRNVKGVSAFAYALYDYALPMINAAKPGQTIVFDFGMWNSFPKAFMEKIAAKSAEGVTFVFNYNWNHVHKKITIPAGTKVNLDFAWYGPAKMDELYGKY